MVGPQITEVATKSKGFVAYDQMLPMRRRGAVEETYWNYSFTPILGDDGKVSGVFNQGHETTDRVNHGRAQDLLIELGDRLRASADGVQPPTAILEATVSLLGQRFGAARCGYCELEDGLPRAMGAEWRRDDGVLSLRSLNHDLADTGRAAASVAAGQVIVRDDVTADPELSDEERERFRQIGVAASLDVAIVRDGRAVALVFVHADQPRRWGGREIATVREAVDRMSFAYERAVATHRMKQSERRFAALFGQTAVGFAELDPEGRLLRVNDSMRRLLGRPAEDLQHRAIEELLHPTDREKWRRLLAQNARNGESFGIEKRYLRPDGAEVWAVSTVTRLAEEEGSASGFFMVTIDVSERREAERLRGLLVAELNHRVRNNIVTVQSLVRHSRMNAVTPQDFEAALDARLAALARAHNLLMRETWTAASLGELVEDTLAPYAIGRESRVRAHGPTILLAPTAAVTLNMALHELATNAAKFGALSNESGRVEVSWSVRGGEMELKWRETDGPLVEAPQRRGFGRRLIERGATQELGGAVTLSFAPGGVTCAFRIPLSQKVMAP